MEIQSGKIAWTRDDDFSSLLVPKKFYSVPKFQRPYEWTTYQRKELLADIRLAQAKGNNFALPEILLQESRKGDVAYYEIGDGQQRITSIVLLLLAIWHRGRETNAPWTGLILPGRQDELGSEGMLGKLQLSPSNEPMIRARILLQADDANRELVRLMSELDTLELKRLYAKDNSTRKQSLIDAFLEFYELLDGEGPFALKELLITIREKVSFPVLVFTPQENMHRSFGRMNSLGVPLSNGALIKAALYGTAVANESRSLGEALVEEWTEKFETSFWGDVKRNSSNLDDALFQALAEIALFPQTTNKGWTQEHKSVSHWLFDQWSELLDRTKSADALQELFDRMKRHLARFKALLRSEEDGLQLTPGTLSWEARLTYDFLGTGKSQTFAIILRILENFKDEPDEALRAFAVLQRFAVMFWLTEPKREILGLLLKPNSVFAKERFTYEELKSYLLAMWPSKLEIQERVEARQYSSANDGVVLRRAFTFADNELIRNARGGLEVGALRPLSNDYDREHILPGNEKAWGKLDEATRSLYRDHVNRIGNTLIFNKSQNRSAQDIPVESKLRNYYNSQSPVLANWLPRVIDLYRVNKTWGPQEILTRTKELASLFAELLDSAKVQ